MMHIDCAIIGGGPAGLSAALVLGRSRRHVLLFDDNRPRNAVTRESHGFITRDGVKPSEFRAIAHQDIARYPSVTVKSQRVTEVRHSGRGSFHVRTGDGIVYHSRTIILAAGLKESLPAVPQIQDYYGKSLFSCPYCDGWELRDKPLVVIGESGSHAVSLAKFVYNWSKDLVVCTNGRQVLTQEQLAMFARKGIRVQSQRIRALKGSGGQLQSVQFEDGSEIKRAGGFVSPKWRHAIDFGEKLGCAMNEHGGLVKDEYGRTTVRGVYAAGDGALITPAQLIIAAGDGSRAALGVNGDIVNEDFDR
ncbi:thioredoxin reductase [Paenibacillus harenae]|uniref:Thioredoxin reductase n=2 Tax=Paenibacillus harenae TaxID=306543 RepID=A0ABT9U1A8_PAEHA|nr:thioredoxin reductase [Paenibacillus harenae]